MLNSSTSLAYAIIVNVSYDKILIYIVNGQKKIYKFVLD